MLVGFAVSVENEKKIEAVQALRLGQSDIVLLIEGL
jgi:hypothetical protein